MCLSCVYFGFRAKRIKISFMLLFYEFQPHNINLLLILYSPLYLENCHTLMVVWTMKITYEADDGSRSSLKYTSFPEPPPVLCYNKKCVND